MSARYNHHAHIASRFYLLGTPSLLTGITTAIIRRITRSPSHHQPK